MKSNRENFSRRRLPNDWPPFSGAQGQITGIAGSKWKERPCWTSTWPHRWSTSPREVWECRSRIYWPHLESTPPFSFSLKTQRYPHLTVGQWCLFVAEHAYNPELFALHKLKSSGGAQPLNSSPVCLIHFQTISFSSCWQAAASASSPAWACLVWPSWSTGSYCLPGGQPQCLPWEGEAQKVEGSDDQVKFESEN